MSGRSIGLIRKNAAQHDLATVARRVVAALGDTAISYDPIAAQGANSGVKQTRHLVESIVARAERPYDAQWLTGTFDAYWNEHARHACAFNNMFLEPIPDAAKEMLLAQVGSTGRVGDTSAPSASPTPSSPTSTTRASSRRPSWT